MLLALTYAPPSVCKLARIEIVPAHYFICRHPSSLPNLGLVMLLPNTPFCSTAATCSAPCPPAASAKRNVQVMSSAAAARGRKPLSPVKKKKGEETICAAYFLGDAPSKYPVELLLVSISITKRRSGGRYLLQLVIMRAGGIGVREVDFCGACD